MIKLKTLHYCNNGFKVTVASQHVPSTYSFEHCKQLFYNKSSLTRHINKGRCDTMSVTTETEQMLDSIKLLKDSNVSDNQIYIAQKNK